MKRLTLIIILIFSLNAYSEEPISVAFSTAKECREATKKLIEKQKDNTVRSLFSEVGVSVDGSQSMDYMLGFVEQLRKDAGEFSYIEEIGVSSLGDFIQRVGYIVKFENLTIFYEVTIGKREPGKYSIVNLSFFFDNDAHVVVEEIPDYYWK